MPSKRFPPGKGKFSWCRSLIFAHSNLTAILGVLPVLMLNIGELKTAASKYSGCSSRNRAAIAPPIEWAYMIFGSLAALGITILSMKVFTSEM